MRRMLVLALVSACSSSSSKPATAALEGAIAANVTNVSRFAPSMFFPLLYLKELPREPTPCWDALEKKLVAGYQLHLNVRPFKSYFIVEGDLPKDEVAACVPKTFSAIKASRDGDLVVFDAMGTKAYAGWHGKFIVLGTKQEVTDALATPTAQSRAKWRGVIGKLPATATAWIYFEDDTLERLFGVPTSSFAFIAELHEKEKTFDGRLVVTYRNEADAATGAGRFQRAELRPELVVPPEIVASIKRMIVKQSGANIEVSFTQETFSGISMEQVQQWAGSVMAK
jgi:hypothetical protein